MVCVLILPKWCYNDDAAALKFSTDKKARLAAVEDRHTIYMHQHTLHRFLLLFSIRFHLLFHLFTVFTLLLIYIVIIFYIVTQFSVFVWVCPLVASFPIILLCYYIYYVIFIFWIFTLLIMSSLVSASPILCTLHFVFYLFFHMYISISSTVLIIYPTCVVVAYSFVLLSVWC